MQTEFLREFAVFAKYMNFTKAAEVLHMSQSNLSKHIVNLEAELKFPLLERSGRKTRLTREGNMFLGNIMPILDQIEFVVDECQRYHLTVSGEIHVQEPPFLDDAAKELYRFISRFRSIHSTIDVSFTQVHKATLAEALNERKVDLVMMYTDNVMDEDLDQVVVGHTKMLAWMDEGHILAREQHLTLNKLADVKIMQPSDAYSPLAEMISRACENQGFKPRYYFTSFTFKTEYLFSSPKSAVYIVPDVRSTDVTMMARAGMVFREIEDFDAKVVLVTKKDSDNPCVGKLQQFLHKTFCE